MLVAVQLHAAIQALADGEPAMALRRVRTAESALREAAPLWSLVATMQEEAFQTFRVVTEGASAIQSRNCKLAESLCRRPDPSRLDSAAYLAVPEVRRRVLAGQATLDEAFEVARAAGRLSLGDVTALEEAMRQYAATLLRWRRTHHKNAMRMLGERAGTGYTKGAAYLKAAQAIPVFRSVAVPADDEGAAGREPWAGAQVAPEPAVDGIAPRGRCPFAGMGSPAPAAET